MDIDVAGADINRFITARLISAIWLQALLNVGGLLRKRKGCYKEETGKRELNSQGHRT